MQNIFNRAFIKLGIVGALSLFSISIAQSSTTTLSNQPIFTSNSVPPNMMLNLSVEWPTGVVAAYNDNYSSDTGYTCPGRNGSGYGVCYFASRRYLGYFDPERCYSYRSNSGSIYNTPDTPLTNGRTAAAAAGEYFYPTGTGGGTYKHTCGGTAFSGNYLNWTSMHAIDEFRFAMTGGDRVIDNSSLTVVEKARHEGSGGYTQFPIKQVSNSNMSVSGTTITAVGVSNVTPYNWTNAYARVNNNAEINSFNDAATRGRVVQISNNSSFSHNGSTQLTYTFLVRVKLCDANAIGGLEYNSAGDYQNCQRYSSGNYKPVGLIQKYSEKMRFGATGYLLDNSGSRAGGVLRARLKSVGPNLIIPNSYTTTANPNSEWSSTTGVYVTNPDTDDASASGVSNSGVINYLNEFGKANGYKKYDTYSELYYATLRALRNLTPVPQYVSSVTTSMKDGFPVITTIADNNNTNKRPIQYYCQQNNILGIGDTNCHTDVYIPGNTQSGYSGHPTTGLTDPAGIDVLRLDNIVGCLQTGGTGASCTAATVTGGSINNLGTLQRERSNSYHVAGLAYWANTRDIMPDDATMPWTTGKQTAKSYFVDVMETGSAANPAKTTWPTLPTWTHTGNQFWLAAKFGGFADDNNDGIPAYNSTSASWDTDLDSVPDNYFTGERPDKLIDSLGKIIQNALARNLSNSGFTMSDINFTATTDTDQGTYAVKYNSGDWTGDVIGYRIGVDASGNITKTQIWSTQSKLDTQVTGAGWDTGRKIVTSSSSGSTGFTSSPGVVFRMSGLNSTQKTYLGSTTTVQTNVLEYLRGNKTYDGSTFRKRSHILGDVVDSEAVVMTPPEEKYTDSYNPGYAAFKANYANRKRMLFVGANDGMMHAIDADVGSATTSPAATAGSELFAYVPNLVLDGPNGTPTVDGLVARTAITDFAHKYYVNATPAVRDVDFSRTKGATATATGNWHTIVVGGLGKGGRGYYALDVTDPSSWTTEANVATKVLWEFTDEDMGYSYGRPVVVKTERDGWVVILSSGYNNITSSTAANRGKGFLYILNAKTGALIEKISTGVGTATDPSGFAHPSAFIPQSVEFKTDYIYGGDLLGNLWRFDLRGTPTTYAAPTKIATLVDSSGIAQPITTEPKVEIGSNGVKRWVVVATGRLLDASDFTDKQQQTVYAIRDGSRSQVFGTGTSQIALPGALTFPIVPRSKMSEVTSLLDGYNYDSDKPMGWYYDLATTTTTSEKVVTNLVANEGVISWNAYLPTADDPCSPNASANIYATEIDTGISRLTDLTGLVIEKSSYSSYIVKAQFVRDASGKIRLVISDGSTSLTKQTGNYGRTAGTAVRINWKEITK